MLDLTRTHDFQVHLSPGSDYPAVVNPPSFNWPENQQPGHYRLELKNLSSAEQWNWERVNSPVQPSFQLSAGVYQWRLVLTSETDAISSSGASSDSSSKSYSENNGERFSDWVEFQITEELPNYLAPTARELFKLCEGQDQWLLYFDEDLPAIREHCTETYLRLKQTAELSVPQSQIHYPEHYQRGREEGKREAIADSRKWIDRDLITHALLYRVWGEQEHGQEALRRLLQLAQWSPEGPASLLRPCTWGDEVGCSLARNLFLAYHWLSPLLSDAEQAFIRPMLIRIARQITERLAQDIFRQYPGHSHTSRLPAYLGVAALVLHREHDQDECEQWLNEALMLYRGILPFYGGADGSWAEGAFYASTYSKWFHPFFSSVERLSEFSFYEHPFYQNFHKFACDFITTEQAVHPFGDGFWCRRDGLEWPGFFSQNPLRIYAARFGDEVAYQRSQSMENSITDYHLHLLDVVPTKNQLAFELAARKTLSPEETPNKRLAFDRFYSHAGMGKSTQGDLSIYYRASAFGNSSHRHGDQGNIALFDNDIGVLIPTGSYGYRFGSQHHKMWTRQTIAHNLPLIDGAGQILDDPKAIGRVLQRQTEPPYWTVTMDLQASYGTSVERYHRTLVLVAGYGLIIVDSITLNSAKTLNWRLHSSLQATSLKGQSTITLAHPTNKISQYQCGLLSHCDVAPTLVHGYSEELSMPTSAIESDASNEVVHLDWQLPAQHEHQIIACCIKEDLAFPEIRSSQDESWKESVLEVTVDQKLVSISVKK